MKEREKFGSRLGFILVSAGCAVGLGNVWKFPYICGINGGAAFVLIYLVFLAILGFPIVCAEFAIGRGSGKGAARAFEVLEKKGSKWHYFKWVSVVGSYILMAFYTMVAGWMLYYAFKEASGSLTGVSSEQITAEFGNMLGNPGVMIVWMLIAILLSFGVCALGLEKGIEKITKVMMSCLIVLIVVLAIHSLVLPGASEGAILTVPEQIKKYKGFFPRLLRNLEFMEYAQAFLAGRSYASELNSVYTLSGAFSAFRKSVVLKSWMYNTDTICEDTHITFQMRYRQDERVEVCEDALFFVDPIEDVNKLYTQRQRWQRGSLEVAKMFMDKDFKLKNFISDVSVKTLLYDHTFAFPRMIWYLALICLMVVGYSGKVIILSTGIIFALYILVGYMYFITASHYLKINKEVRSYYISHWWCVLLLPFFNLAVFFIRMAGIINSIQTDSSWKTKTLTQECAEFAGVVKSDLKKVTGIIEKIRHKVNISADVNDRK